MSTNYYLKRIPTEDEITQCHKLLDDRKNSHLTAHAGGTRTSSETKLWADTRKHRPSVSFQETRYYTPIAIRS